MFIRNIKNKRSLNLITRKAFHYIVLTIFIVSQVCGVSPQKALAQSPLNLPAPGTMVAPSAGYTPAMISGITIYPENPLQFDFIIDTGDDYLQGEELRRESKKLINYFLATLTVPEDEMWVNLSPYEKDRIIADGLGVTEMGRDMLAQDYMLKQLTASLMYPEEEIGEAFWKKIYAKAQARFGTTEIPTNMFNKVWIVPEKTVVYITGTSVFVSESHLKVMLEEDYLALESNKDSTKHGLGDMTVETIGQLRAEAKEVIREVIIPEIEKEVNTGKNFANLRQIYNSMILAAWYKKNLRESILGSVYMDSNKTSGSDLEDKNVKEKIYNQYVEAFQKGVYNYIKEDYDESKQQIIPRKYFSGGLEGVEGEDLKAERSEQARQPVEKSFADDGDEFQVIVYLDMVGDDGNVNEVKTGEGSVQRGSYDNAMLTQIWSKDGRLNKDGILLAHAAIGFPENGVLLPNSYFGNEPALLRNPRQLVEFSWNNIIHYWMESSYVILLPFNRVIDRDWVNLWFTATAHMGSFQLPPGARIMVREGSNIPDGQEELLRNKGIEVIRFNQKSSADLAALEVIEEMGYQPTTMYGSRFGGIETTWNEGDTFKNFADEDNLPNLIQRMRELAEELGIPSAAKTDDYDIGFLTFNMEKLYKVFVGGSDLKRLFVDYNEFENVFQRVSKDQKLGNTVVGRRFLQYAQYYRDFYRIFNLGAMEYGNALFYVSPSLMGMFREDGLEAEVEEALQKRSAMVRAFNETFGFEITEDELSSEDDFKELVRMAGEKRSMNVKDEAMESEVGGIDFNPGMLDLEGHGGQINYTVDNSMLQNLQPNSVHGIRPIIINITPIVNYLPLLGLSSETDLKSQQLSKLVNTYRNSN